MSWHWICCPSCPSMAQTVELCRIIPNGACSQCGSQGLGSLFAYKTSNWNSSFSAAPSCCDQQSCSLLASVIREVSSLCLSSSKVFLLASHPPTPSPAFRNSETPQPAPFCTSTFCSSCCLYSPNFLPFNLCKTDLPWLVLRQEREGTNRHFSSPQHKSVGCSFSSSPFLLKAVLTELLMAAHKSSPKFHRTLKWFGLDRTLKISQF